jgi:hypothetical protein
VRIGGFGVLVLWVLFTVGCGGGNSEPSTGEHGHGNGDRYVWIDKSFNPSHANHPVNA